MLRLFFAYAAVHPLAIILQLVIAHLASTVKYDDHPLPTSWS